MDTDATETRFPAALEEQVEVRREGFTTLSEGGQRPIVDIVFVHGLGGHPRKTWTSTESDLKETKTPTENGQPMSKKSRKSFLGFGRSKKPKDQRHAEFIWPQAQLAKDFPEARILTYGYDCSVVKLFEAADRRGIIAHGDDLLAALGDQRLESRDRPIIFVVHSLGGLILKRALWASRDSARAETKTIFECTIGIMFYGTPHRGGNYVNLGNALAHAVKAMGHSVSDQIVRNLDQDSEILELLRKEFVKMLDAEIFEIHSFYETKGLTFSHFAEKKVVDKISATLEHRRETVRSAPGNHMEMCKFTGPKDARYEAVKAIVQGFLASERVQRTREISNCISSLKVVEMDNERSESRLYNIVIRHQATLNWLFQDVVIGPDETVRRPGFLQWIRGGKGIFWIRGIPASGKSTAMKHIHYRMKVLRRHELKSWLHVAVFFHDRGTNEQKTMLGMLRSILRQLILGCPDWLPMLIPLIAPFGRVDSSQANSTKTNRHGADDWLWTVEGLQKAITAVAAQQHFAMNVFLMVDALDEHNGDHEGMVRFLQDLAAPTETCTFKFQILLASRPDPPFNDILRDHPYLSIHEWTEEDVKSFVTSTFKEDQSFQNCLSYFHDSRDFPPKLEAAIVRRARGVFLWVRLIIEDILDQVKSRRLADVMALSQRLAKLPDDLVHLYTRILKRVPSKESIETYILLETVLRARRPMTVLELAYVLMLGLDKVSRKLDEQTSLESRLDQGKVDLIEKNAWSYVDRYIGLCKGLLQVYGRYSEHPWLDENESMWSAPVYQRFMPITQTQVYETKASTQSNQDAMISSFTRKGTTDTAFSDGMALPERDSLVHHGQCPEAHWHIQLLHQSVKEYMLEENGKNLDNLFKRPDPLDDTADNVECIQRPADNGHVYILDWCVQILRKSKPTPEHIPTPLYFRLKTKHNKSIGIQQWLAAKTIAECVLHNGVYAEKTLRRSFMMTLDKADRYLQVELRREDWPAEVLRQDGVKGWNFNFIAYAIGANMYCYVDDKLRQRPDLVNGKKGRPLLFFAVWTPGGVACTEPEMVQLLLRHKADVRAQWVDGEGNKKDALRSMQYHQCDISGYPLKEIMLLLLRAGADPDLAVIGSKRSHRRPLSHQVMMMDISAGGKMEVLRALKEAGANFAAKDSERLGLLDIYCQRLLGGNLREEFSITELEWILEVGARITAGMFNSDGFKRTLLYADELRRPSYYTYDGQKAARKDNPEWPDFSILRTLFGH